MASTMQVPTTTASTPAARGATTAPVGATRGGSVTAHERKQQQEFAVTSTLFPGADALDSLHSFSGAPPHSAAGSRQQQYFHGSMRPTSTQVPSRAASVGGGLSRQRQRLRLARDAPMTSNPQTSPSSSSYNQQPQRSRTVLGVHSSGAAGTTTTSTSSSFISGSGSLSGRVGTKPVSSHQVRWWRDFVWPQLGQELRSEVQQVEDKVRALLAESLLHSASTTTVHRKGNTAVIGGTQSSGNGAVASTTTIAKDDHEDADNDAVVGDDDTKIDHIEEWSTDEAAKLTDQVFDISFRHLLRRDPQFHTALRHSVHALDETRHDVDVATQMAFTAMISSQTWHQKLAKLGDTQRELQAENERLRAEATKIKLLVSDMEDEMLSNEYRNTKLGLALRADTGGKGLEDRVAAVVSEMRRVKACQRTLKRLLPSWRLYYGDESLHEFLDYEDSEKPSADVMGALQQDVVYLMSLLGLGKSLRSSTRASIISLAGGGSSSGGMNVHATGSPAADR